MEGLIKDTKKTGNNVYLSIFGGKLAMKTNAENPNGLKRLNKNGVTVFEEFFTGVKGMIKQVAISDTQYGKELIISVVNGETTFVIQTSTSGGYSFGFLSRLPNVDFTQPVEIKPFDLIDKATNKKKNLLVVYQEGKGYEKNKVPSAFTKDEPNGLPQMKKIMFKGAEVWDDTERVEFFEQMIYNSGGLNDMLSAMYSEKEAAPDNFLNDLNEVTEPEETKKNFVFLGDEKVVSKTPAADAAQAHAEAEGAKIAAAKKAAAKAAKTKV